MVRTNNRNTKFSTKGLAYTNNAYDIERYKRLRDISAEMLSMKTEISLEKSKRFIL